MASVDLAVFIVGVVFAVVHVVAVNVTTVFIVAVVGLYRAP